VFLVDTRHKGNKVTMNQASTTKRSITPTENHNLTIFANSATDGKFVVRNQCRKIPFLISLCSYGAIVSEWLFYSNSIRNHNHNGSITTMCQAVSASWWCEIYNAYLLQEIIKIGKSIELMSFLVNFNNLQSTTISVVNLWTTFTRKTTTSISLMQLVLIQLPTNVKTRHW